MAALDKSATEVRLNPARDSDPFVMSWEWITGKSTHKILSVRGMPMRVVRYRNGKRIPCTIECDGGEESFGQAIAQLTKQA